MRRREFIAGLGGTVAIPLAARAQQTTEMRRIGVLMPLTENDPLSRTFIGALREGLQQAGWNEGRNIQIVLRWAHNAEVRQRLAKELVALQPDLILSHSTPNTAALLQETKTIPTVFVQVTDPVGSGFVASIPRPGGNATGFITSEWTMAGKWLELLKEIAPRVGRVALVFNPATATYAEHYVNAFKAAAPSFDIKGIIAPVRGVSELEAAVAAQGRARDGGLAVMPDPFMVANRAAVTSLVARYLVPTISAFRFYTEDGALLSYGNDVPDSFRRAAIYVDRILKGERPSQLAIQAPVKFELVINLKTAKALGLEVPMFLQQRADEVIE
jgi:putative ABC transport system substrate-binding protein